MNANLILSTGERFSGKLIGAPICQSGELVYTTGMVGYAEAATDPSYFGQMLVFTYPLIGNYGVPKFQSIETSLSYESDRIHASSFVFGTESEKAFHWNSVHTFHEWL